MVPGPSGNVGVAPLQALSPPIRTEGVCRWSSRRARTGGGHGYPFRTLEPTAPAPGPSPPGPPTPEGATTTSPPVSVDRTGRGGANVIPPTVTPLHQPQPRRAMGLTGSVAERTASDNGGWCEWVPGGWTRLSSRHGSPYTAPSPPPRPTASGGPKPSGAGRAGSGRNWSPLSARTRQPRRERGADAGSTRSTFAQGFGSLLTSALRSPVRDGSPLPSVKGRVRVGTGTPPTPLRRSRWRRGSWVSWDRPGP